MKLPFILASRFVAGEALEQTIPAIKSINEKGIAVSLDLLGENVSDRKVADATLLEYQNLIKGISDLGLNSSISIKLTMMGLDIDGSYTIDNLHKLLTTAREYDIFVRIDMEGSPYTQRTIDIFKSAHNEFEKNVGIVIQAYLKRSKEDIVELANLGADVRLCKGAYSEPASIAIKKMSDIRSAYREMAKNLLAKTSMPRFASHDDQIIDWVKSYTKQEGIDKSSYEFQMLYGLRQDTCEKMAEDGHNVRIYVPYGTMWVPYFTRRLKERKENIFFVVGNLFKK
jgi:proline dehydrogenase